MIENNIEKPNIEKLYIEHRTSNIDETEQRSTKYEVLTTALIITGSAPCVVEGIEAALSFLQSSAFSLQTDFMAIGLSSVDKHLYHIKYMATYHPAEIPEIKKRREMAGGNTDYLVISHERRPDVDIIEPFVPPTGSSAHLGALAAIRLGYKKMILCGCPMRGDSPTHAGSKYETFWAGWTAKIEIVKPYVRSMSGWTRELLGAPTEEWLKN
jgi:hypothetical protein